MARNKQISRIYNILLLLEYAPHGLSVRGLYDRLLERGHCAGIRSIYRDLVALRNAGFSLVEKGTNPDNATTWALEQKTRLTKALPLTEEEEILMLSFLRQLNQQASPEMQQVVPSIIAKIQSQLRNSSQRG
jgi:predicted DNA-binding transcriptional regulator YafY